MEDIAKLKKVCCCGSTADRISNLPANVTDQILSSLSLKTAAKASLLSKKWRNRWRSIPVLVFDRRFGRLPQPYPVPNKRMKLMMKIYKVLLLHNGPIAKFGLSIPGMTPCSEIDHMILYLADKVTEEFSLRFGEGRRENPPSDKRVWGPPGAAVVKTSLTVGFSKLTVLELKEVAVPSDFCENFVPKCPLLEKLTLLNCNGFDRPELVAPRLKSLFFHSSFLISFSFECTPLLSLVSILDPDEYEYMDTIEVEYDDNDMVPIFASLPALQQLNLGLEFMILLNEAGKIPARLPTPLQHLTVLEIPKIILSNVNDAKVLVCLIKSSPNLCSLTITHDIGKQRPRGLSPMENLQMLLEPEEEEPDATNDFLGCLESFNIHNSQGSKLELELVKFVLANAPKLCRVYITPTRHIGFMCIARYLKEVIGYKHASKEAHVLYDWGDTNFLSSV